MLTKNEVKRLKSVYSKDSSASKLIETLEEAVEIIDFLHKKSFSPIAFKFLKSYNKEG